MFHFFILHRYIVSKCAMLDLHSDNGQGPRPIHWASRNGHVAVVDMLLSVIPRFLLTDFGWWGHHVFNVNSFLLMSGGGGGGAEGDWAKGQRIPRGIIEKDKVNNELRKLNFLK